MGFESIRIPATERRCELRAYIRTHGAVSERGLTLCNLINGTECNALKLLWSETKVDDCAPDGNAHFPVSRKLHAEDRFMPLRKVAVYIG